MLCMEHSRGQRRRWVEIVVGNSEGTLQTEAGVGTVRALVHQLMDGKDVKMTDDMIKSLLELVTVASEDRIWAVIAVVFSSILAIMETLNSSVSFECCCGLCSFFMGRYTSTIMM